MQSPKGYRKLSNENNHPGGWFTPYEGATFHGIIVRAFTYDGRFGERTAIEIKLLSQCSAVQPEELPPGQTLNVNVTAGLQPLLGYIGSAVFVECEGSKQTKSGGTYWAYAISVAEDDNVNSSPDRPEEPEDDILF